MNNTVRFQSMQYPDFYLAEKPNPELLKGISGGIFLENSKHEQRLLLPIKNIEQTDNNKHELTGTILTNEKNQSYFVYDATSQSRYLKPESPNASLYLALLMRAINEPIDAIHYLHHAEKKEPDGKFEWEMIELLVNNKKIIYSPSQAALNLHLHSRMESHQNKMDKKHFTNQSNENKDIHNIRQQFQTIINDQSQYFSQVSSDLKQDITAIPVELRLSPTQELAYSVSPSGVMSLIDTFNPNFSTLIPYQMVSYCLFKNAHRKTKREDYDFVRLMKAQDCNAFLQSHFIELYNKACSQEKEEKILLKMDLFFLWRQANESVELKNLIFILNLVNDSQPAKYQPAPEDPSKHNAWFAALYEKISVGPDQAYRNEFYYNTGIAKSTIPPTVPAKTVERVHVSLSGKMESLKELSRKPFGHIQEAYFEDVSYKKKSSPPFPLADFKASSPLSASLAKQLNEGYFYNLDKHNQLFDAQDRKKTGELKSKLIHLKNDGEQAISYLTKQIETLANHIPSDKEHLIEKTKQEGKQLLRLTLDNSLLTAFMNQDAQMLKKLNPNLSQENILQLFKLTAQLLVEGRNKKIAEAALELSERIEAAVPEQQAVLLDQQAKLLNSTTSYSIDENPEYLVYEFATGTILRPDQVEILNWIFESIETDKLEHLMFQFQAGGGKTKVLMPIIAYKLAQKGLLPVLINYNPLYEIGKSDLDRSLKSSFQQNLEILEINLETKLTTLHFKTILASLIGFKEAKKSLVVRSETFYSLIIAKKAAFESMDKEAIQLISHIFDFLKSNGAGLVDEAHLTLDSLQETNQTTGKSSSLSDLHQQLLYEQMIELIRTDLPFHQKVRLMENQQALLSDNDLEEVRSGLIQRFSQSRFNDELTRHPLLKSIIQQDSLYQFLSNENLPFPEWLNNLHQSESLADKDLAGAVVLIKRFYYKIMPHTLRMIQGVSYGTSIIPGDFTAAPRQDKKPTTSSFQDTAITAVLTIQNMFQTGISDEGLHELFNRLLIEHREELENTRSEKTLAQSRFEAWWGSDPVALETLDLKRPADFTLFKEKIAKNPIAIETFLFQHVLPQIRLFKKKLSATPRDLLEVFNKTISFTATPGMLEAYPHQLQTKGSVKLDLGFESEVIQTLAEPKNQKITVVENGDLDHFFEQLYQDEPDQFKEISTLIDSGAAFRKNKNGEILQAFLKFCETKGIQKTGGIFKEDSIGSAEGNLIYRKGLINQQLSGSDLPAALKKLGENFYAVTLVTLFGLEDTTGADYKQPDKGKAVLSVGEGQTKTKTIQAAMRMRRLLFGKDGQTVRWVISKELAEKIPKAQIDKMTVGDIFGWLIENEALVMEKVIVMRAFQGIKHLIQKIAWTDIDSSTDSVEKVEKYHKYRDGLVDSIEIDPFYSMGQETTKDTLEVLEQYALSCYRKLGFEDTGLLYLSGDDRKFYELILKQTTQLIPKIKVGEENLSGQMHQHQDVQNRQNVDQNQNVVSVGRTFPEDLNPKKDVINEELIFNDLEYSNAFNASSSKEGKSFFTKVNDSFKLDFIPDNVYATNNFLKISLGGELDGALKPISYILLVRENGEDKYLIATRMEAEVYMKQLNGVGLKNKPISRKDIKRQAVLLTSRGEVVKNGGYQFGFATG